MRLATLLKKDSYTGLFHVNFAKLLRTPFFLEHLRWLLRGGTHMTSMKIVQFSRPPIPLSIYVLNSSAPPWPWTSNFKRTPTHPSPNDNQSIKKKKSKDDYYMCYQVLPSGRPSFDFFSFSWSLTVYFFVVLYSCVSSCPKILRNVFHL